MPSYFINPRQTSGDPEILIEQWSGDQWYWWYRDRNFLSLKGFPTEKLALGDARQVIPNLPPVLDPPLTRPLPRNDIDDNFLQRLGTRLRKFRLRPDRERTELREVKSLESQLDTVAGPLLLSQLRKLETRSDEVERILDEEDSRPTRTSDR